MKNPAKRLYLGMILGILLVSVSALIVAKAPTPTPAPGPQLVIIPVLTYNRVTPKPTSIYDFTPQVLENHFKFFRIPWLPTNFCGSIYRIPKATVVIP